MKKIITLLHQLLDSNQSPKSSNLKEDKPDPNVQMETYVLCEQCNKELYALNPLSPQRINKPQFCSEACLIKYKNIQSDKGLPIGERHNLLIRLIRQEMSLSKWLRENR